jgi:hypothetical protein
MQLILVMNEELEGLRNSPEEDKTTATKRSVKESPTKPRKTVRFEPHVKVHDVGHIDDYSYEQISKIWYNDEDTAATKAECADTVRLMIAQQPIDTNTYCSRGLEYRTPEGLRRRQRNKLIAIDAVLDEQDTQWDNDEDDVKFLATVYRECSLPCQAMAHRMAFCDERYVQSLHNRQPMKPSQRSGTPTSKK